MDSPRLREARSQMDLGRTYLQVQGPEDCFAYLQNEKYQLAKVLCCQVLYFDDNQ